MRSLFVLPLLILTAASVRGQETVEPGSKSINQAYFKPASVFQKLSWIDKYGTITRQATLNCVTKIDSANKRLIYLQLRNDGKRDSTIVEWPSLKPIYTATFVGSKEFIYDYRGGSAVKNTTTQNGHVEKDTSFTVLSPYFDSYLTDYLFGALPLKPGYHGQFRIGSGASATVSIKDVFTDVLSTGSTATLQAYVVVVDYNGYKVTYWIDKATATMLKSIYQGPDGSIFMKSGI
ncbi:hypothetical protein ACQ86N_03155 [Puia sp. P3]|uniref:hypothetical protein n=1 Tax=Puia sp. P3 TaxID=3423952 RepID=UPI003D67DE70